METQSTAMATHNALIRTEMDGFIINHGQFPRKKPFPAFQFNINLWWI